MTQTIAATRPSRAEVPNLLRNLAEPVPVATVAPAINLHHNTTRLHLEAPRQASPQQPLNRSVGATDLLGYRPQLENGAEPTIVLQHCPFPDPADD